MSKNTLLIALLTSIVLAAICVPAGAVPPTKEWQMCYGISAWTGMTLEGTIAPRQADTIYLIADHNNIIHTAETEVYYWPITGEYKANWMEYREVVDGTLEIYQGGKLYETLEKRDYTTYYTESYGQGQVHLAFDEEATIKYQEYQTAMDNYWNAVRQFYDDKAAWDALMTEMLKEVQETGIPKKPEEIPEPPVQPEMPKFYVYKPQAAFVLNLPPGEYKIRMLDTEGQEVADSARKLVVYSHRRTGLGYQMRPDSRWNQFLLSNDISQVIYVKDETAFYMLPFESKEYDRFYYIRMLSLHSPLAGQGTKGMGLWVQLEEMPGLTLQVLHDGKVVQEISKKPYYVEQTSGYALGYNVVEFDPEAEGMTGRTATFEGYKLDLTDNQGTWQLRFVDANGDVVPGSVRELRWIQDDDLWVIFVVALIPLLVGLVVMWRRKMVVKHAKTKVTA
ncbi:MAG: hypothetical protein ACOYEN_05190 [Limnochordia bacterium]|jgi:hypothetical protein